MVLHNPNNWHWVNKNVAPWAKQWFEDNLTSIEAKDGEVTAKVSKVVSMDGDVDVSQRKGKVITIFDVKLVLEYSGEVPGEGEVTGTITVPEVAHDTEEDEYVFEIDIHAEAPSKQPVKDLVRSKITPQLRTEFQKLSGALIEEHGKDIQHAPDAQPSAITPAKVHPPTGAQAKAAEATSSSSSTSKPIHVTTTEFYDQVELPISADMAYKTFVDPQLVAAVMRAPTTKWEEPRVGAKFEISGGSVKGEFLELEENKRIVQAWRFESIEWPQGHYSKLAINFDQNNSGTVIRVEWSGVPLGQEKVPQNYMQSIKGFFGVGIGAFH